jgi:hypothetical protein
MKIARSKARVTNLAQNSDASGEPGHDMLMIGAASLFRLGKTVTDSQFASPNNFVDHLGYIYASGILH